MIEVIAQVANAPSPILPKPLPMIVTEAKLLAESKALTPIVFMLSGIMIEVRDVHKRKALSGMAVTPEAIVTAPELPGAGQQGARVAIQHY